MKDKQKKKRWQGKAPPEGRGCSLPNSQTQKKESRQTLPASKYRPRPYPMEVRRRAVQLHLEEGIPVEDVSREIGVSVSTVWMWAKRYRQHGEAGLQDAARGPKPGQLPEPVRETIVALKTTEPRQGVRWASTAHRGRC